MTNKVFYSPTFRFGTIDFVGPNGRSGYAGKTLEELQAHPLYSPLVEIIDIEEASRRSEAKLITEPEEIDADRFEYYLEVLPPCKWGRYNGGEAFHVSEHIRGSIVTWCVRVGPARYFTLQDSCYLAPQKVIDMVVQKFFPNSVGAS